MFHIFAKIFTKINYLVMKKIALVTLFFIFSSFSLIAQEKEVINKMIEEVTFLASDQLEGRQTGTKSETEAIYKQYAGLLLAPTEVTGGFFISSPGSTSQVVTGRDQEMKSKL